MLDAIVVGAGLTGAVVARELVDAGFRTLLLERGHVGGACRDTLDEPTGVTVNAHGPHYFRTDSDVLWKYVHRFAELRPFEPRCVVRTERGIQPWPPTGAYMQELYGVVDERDFRALCVERGWFTPHPQNFEQAAVALLGRPAFEELIEGYTRKHWGRSAAQLDAAMARRLRIAWDGDTRLTTHRHQGLPLGGYSAFISAIASGIPIEYRAFTAADLDRAEIVVYTGAIDELCSHRFGRLPYRGHVQAVARPARGLSTCQINEASPAVTRTRTVDYGVIAGLPAGTPTVTVAEVPREASTAEDALYPYPDAAARALHARYLQCLPSHVVACGRLGTYRYLDMDHAIADALATAARLRRGGS